MHRWIFFVLLLITYSCAGNPMIVDPSPDIISIRSSAPHEVGYDAELSSYSYPWPVGYFHFTEQGEKINMAYMDVNPEIPNGRVVLLLHGKNFNSSYWERTIHTLSDQGFRVIAVDQIGFGKSTKPSRFQYSLHGLASFRKRLLEKIEVGKASVLGHSMGGMLGVRFALMFPETVEKLVLVNPIGLEDWRMFVPHTPVSELYEQELKKTIMSVKDYMRENYFEGDWLPEYQFLIDAYEGWLKHPDYTLVAWNAALTTDMLFTQPVLYEFPLLKVPTLLIIGTKDKTAIGKDRVDKELSGKLGNYKELGKRAKRSIPHAELREIPEAGHIPMVDAFSAYRAFLLAFLK